MTAPIAIRRGGDGLTPEELAAVVAVFHALAAQQGPEEAPQPRREVSWTRTAAGAQGTSWANRGTPGWKPHL
ncbi:acyl-CoA carboxylase subunit epsilon [Actinokineospora bangkokensis]|uniref:Uncharacterized protein n=1 Tax=Actinokineospora bangkokensis TaxID=1193682 RepID=A0A1Q9LK48_9PSEU|nr:acyl-CoA carboxylase subunit epsilon [Actinokineospora bangkokensis]OLR92421.1 hypothetical protein BJP25_20260 [Actinokineospora bangkokensis]